MLESKYGWLPTQLSFEFCAHCYSAILVALLGCLLNKIQFESVKQSDLAAISSSIDNSTRIKPVGCLPTR